MVFPKCNYNAYGLVAILYLCGSGGYSNRTTLWNTGTCFVSVDNVMLNIHNSTWL